MPNEITSFLHKKILTPLGAVALAVLCVVGTAGFFLYGNKASAPVPSADQLYAMATHDALTIEEDELFPLVCLTPQSGQVEWKNGKVLLATLNKKPQLYMPGGSLSLPGEVWVVSARELADWYQTHKNGVSDWPTRLHQVVGVPLSSQYTHITALWVNPKDIIRPAYSTDISLPAMPTELPQNVSAEYREWFNANIIWSYFDSSYPWTRIGYTYDWAAGSGEYGLTEFLIQKNAQVDVAYTRTIADHITHLEQTKAE